MEFVNICKGKVPDKSTSFAFVQILSPYAPHIAEELWSMWGHNESISQTTWPEFDPKALIEDEIQIVVQVQGKLRARINVSAQASKEEILAAAKVHENIAGRLEGKTIIKEIFVPKKLINFFLPLN